MILCITCYSCDDPYKDTVFKVYDVQPAATYLQNRPDDFSEWVKVLKYGDLFNAVNRAEDAFTVLAPTNDAVLRFYQLTIRMKILWKFQLRLLKWLITVLLGH